MMDARLALRERIVRTALSYQNTRFHHGGRLPGVGLDCIGVIVCVARECGLAHQDQAAYSLRPTGELRPQLEAQLVRVEGEPRPGDVLEMAFEDGMTLAPAHHLAIYVGDNAIIHAHVRARKCVKQEYTSYWRAHTTGVWRFPELA